MADREGISPFGWVKLVADAHAVRPAGARALLYALARHADAYGVAWPTQETLAAESGQTDRAVRDNLPRLVELGVLTHAGKHPMPNGKVSDRWRLVASGLVRAASPEGSSGRKEAPAGRSCTAGRKNLPGSPEGSSDKVSMQVSPEVSRSPLPPARGGIVPQNPMEATLLEGLEGTLADLQAEHAAADADGKVAVCGTCGHAHPGGEVERAQAARMEAWIAAVEDVDLDGGELPEVPDPPTCAGCGSYNLTVKQAALVPWVQGLLSRNRGTVERLVDWLRHRYAGRIRVDNVAEFAARWAASVEVDR